MKPKLNTKQIYRITGTSGLLLGIYMLWALKNNGGFIPLVISLILLWVGFKK